MELPDFVPAGYRVFTGNRPDGVFVLTYLVNEALQLLSRELLEECEEMPIELAGLKILCRLR